MKYIYSYKKSSKLNPNSTPDESDDDSELLGLTGSVTNCRLTGSTVTVVHILLPAKITCIYLGNVKRFRLTSCQLIRLIATHKLIHIRIITPDLFWCINFNSQRSLIFDIFHTAYTQFFVFFFKNYSMI